MEDNIYPTHLIGTGHASETLAVSEHIRAASSRMQSEYTALEQRMLSVLGPVSERVDPVQPLLIESGSTQLDSEPELPLFAGYQPSGRLADAEASTARTSTEDDKAIMVQFWGEPGKFEKYRNLLRRAPRMIGKLAVTAFHSLEEKLAPTLIEDEPLFTQSAGLTESYAVSDIRERRRPSYGAIARAAACVAIAGSLSAGVVNFHRDTGTRIAVTQNSANAQIAPDLTIEDVSKIAEALLPPPTTTTIAEQVTTTSTTTTLAEQQPAAVRVEPKAVSAEADCSMTQLKAAPIERALYVADLLQRVHGLTARGAAILTANFAVETGNLDPLAENKPERAHGLAQWRDDRLIGIPNDLDGQLAFAINVEMHRDGKGYLVDLLRDPSATSEQINNGIRDWERYGEEGGRKELGKKFSAFLSRCDK